MRQCFKITGLLIMVVIWGSCRNDFEYAQSNGNLEFSRDTIFLDTVFTNISSSTRTLKVYNRTRDDIEIPVIRLARGQSSSYRLNVDGEAGKEFENIPILARDSLFIFVESTFDISQTNQLRFLNTDAIQFDMDAKQQKVQLISLVKDAVFLFPETRADGTKETVNIGVDSNNDESTIEGFYLTDDQLNLTNEKPYVIYGYAVVPEGKQLTIAAGTRVHFHKDSGIYVTSGSTLRIDGALSEDQRLLENEVVFQGDRLESDLQDVSGQWGSVWISPKSIKNTIDYLTIRNATVGILVEGDGVLESPTLSIKNSRILNSASINLWAKSARVHGENLVLGGAGNSSLYCNLGGMYSFVHCTIANFWQNGFRTGAALEIDNFDSTGAADLTEANFVNCIITGNTFLELNLRNNQTNSFKYFFTNSIIRFNQGGSQFENELLYDFDNTLLFKEVILNENPNFFDTSENDFRIKDPSPVRDNASFEGANLVPLDILGRDRSGSPDIGAYEVETSNEP